MSSPEAAGSRAGLRSLSWTSHFRHAAGAEGGDGRFLGLWASLAGTRGNSGGWSRSVRPGPASVGPTWASTGQGVLAKEGETPAVAVMPLSRHPRVTPDQAGPACCSGVCARLLLSQQCHHLQPAQHSQSNCLDTEWQPTEGLLTQAGSGSSSSSGQEKVKVLLVCAVVVEPTFEEHLQGYNTVFHHL